MKSKPNTTTSNPLSHCPCCGDDGCIGWGCADLNNFDPPDDMKGQLPAWCASCGAEWNVHLQVTGFHYTAKGDVPCATEEFENSSMDCSHLQQSLF